VWQKAKALAVRIYRETEPFPRAESYGLTSQLRRAAVSAASNIARAGEGLRRASFGGFWNTRAVPSSRLSTQIAIASDLGYLDEQAYLALEHEACEMLGLINRLLESLRPYALAAL
jgi:four helix bundle protein